MVGQPMNTNIQTISTDVALRLVADRRRRAVLYHLINNADGAMTVTALVDEMVGPESVLDAGTWNEAQTLSASLHHNHLPKLADSGVVDLDTQRATVRYRPTPPMEKLVQFVTEELE